MTCRHRDPVNNPECSSYRTPEQQAETLQIQLWEIKSKYKLTDTPDAAAFEIEDAVQVGEHMVLKVRYPNCAKCSYEGNKVMVFLDVTPIDVMRWKKIDPHFRNPKSQHTKEAPSPAARFPASTDGWLDALAYARGKCKSTPK